MKMFKFIDFVTFTAGNPSLWLNSRATLCVCSHMTGTPKMGCFASLIPSILGNLCPLVSSQTVPQIDAFSYLEFIWQYYYNTHPYKWVEPPRKNHGQ